MNRPVIFTSLLCLLVTFPLLSQVNISGALQSNLYVTENSADNNLTDFYQSLRLRVAPEQNSNLYFNTFFRMARQGESVLPTLPVSSPGVDYQWNERIYNLYLNWKTAQKRVHLRFGRQFLYEGVLNGTFDGGLVTARLNPKIKVKLFLGLETPFSREFDLLSWNDGNAFGGHVTAKLPHSSSLDLSYIQRSRNKETVWQIGEVALHGTPTRNFFYLVEYDHNFQSEALQGLRVRANYYYQKWGFSAEYNHQKPRVFEDSFFRIFEIEAYNQIRTGASYRLNHLEIGVQYLYTIYKNSDNSNELIGSLAGRYGSIGLVYQRGYAGKNTGIFGDVRYPLLPWLTLHAHSSYYKYERHIVDISEDATAYTAGMTLQPQPRLKVSAEVQESINSRYSNDVRALFRLNYAIRN